ncbi:MAG: ECF transporter S component [Lachnospiraceae bacterium]|jgi:riboflavin transporter FmnP
METKNTRKKITVKEIVLIGMFCALAYAVMFLSKMIPINVAGFLTFDLKDVIIIICGFMMGPVPAVIVSVITSVIEMLTVSSTGYIGLLMNVISTCAFVVPAAIFYKKHRKFAGAIIGIIIGILCMTLVMMLWNWLITPLYMGVPRKVVASMLLPVFLPFNALKGGINAAAAILLYKPVVLVLRKARLAKDSPSGQTAKKKGLSIGAALASIFVLATLILLVLVWTKVI